MDINIYIYMYIHIYLNIHIYIYIHVSLACWPQGSDVEVVRHAAITSWPVGLMDKASASGAGDSRLECWAGHGRCCHARQHAAVQPAVCRTHAVLPQLAVMIAAANSMGSVA